MARPDKQPIVGIYTEDGESLLVDSETGEVLEGKPPKMERLLAMAINAEGAEKAWATAAATYKAIIARELREADLRKVSGGAGDAVRVVGANHYLGNTERFAQWMEDVEFPPDAIRALLACAVSFNVEGFIRLCESLGIEERDARKVINTTPFEYVRLTGPKLPPPRVEKHARTE